eukprot:scaffold75271_cov65-Attheya_sp.AAC.1
MRDTRLSGTSAYAMSLIIPMIYAALFANAKIYIDPQEVLAKSSPSCDKLKTLVADAAVDSMFAALNLIREESSKVFLICDKGSHNNFIKMLVWYSEKKNQYKLLTLTTTRSEGPAKTVHRQLNTA